MVISNTYNLHNFAYIVKTGKVRRMYYSPSIPAGSVIIAKDHIYGTNYKREQKQYTLSMT